MALPRLPHHLSLLINTGRKRAGSRSEGSEPAGLAASLAGAGGAGAVPCCQAPVGRRRQAPTRPAWASPQPTVRGPAQVRRLG